MIRRIIISLLRFTLRIYFRRVEVAGLERVPHDDPVIFILNHPNALVDPCFLLCLAPRKVSFLAKAPLFRMPVIGSFVRALDSLPVYRQQDQGEDVNKNRETFAAAANCLANGGTIGICPEGISHDRPGLQPIKTGAARMALGAVATGQAAHLKIVPAGLYYTSKTSFRSDVLLYFGKPIEVQPAELEDGLPPRAAVRELSQVIEDALRNVMLDAQHEEALQTITRAEEIFSAESDAEENESSLADELRLRQQFIKGYTALMARAPDRVRKLEARIKSFDQQLNQAGVDPVNLTPPESTGSLLKQILKRSLLFLLMLGPALLGMVIHFPAYRLGGVLSSSLFRQTEDVISTIKIISAMLFFPITWLILGIVGFKFGGAWTLVLLPILPITGYIAMRFLEEWDTSIAGLRALAYFLTKRRFFVRLLAERRAIKAEILALGDEAALITR